MTTRKIVNKLKQTNKRYSIKGWHTKEFLKKGTRLDDQIKKTAPLENVVGLKRVCSPIYSELYF